MNNNDLQSNDDSPVKPKDLSQQLSPNACCEPSSLTHMINSESENVLRFINAEQKQLVPQIMMMRANLEQYVNELLQTMKMPRPDRLIDRIDALGEAAEAAETSSGRQPGCNGDKSGGSGNSCGSCGGGSSSADSGVNLHISTVNLLLQCIKYENIEI